MKFSPRGGNVMERTLRRRDRTLKTEQRKKNLRVKQGNREVFQMKVWKVACLIVEQHRKVKGKSN